MNPHAPVKKIGLTLAQARMIYDVWYMGARFATHYEPNSTWKALRKKGILTDGGLTEAGGEMLSELVGVGFLTLGDLNR